MSVDGSWQPYPAYKDSGVEWLAEIPGHWNIKSLRYVVDSIKNGTTARQLGSGESDYRVTRIETISTGKINLAKVGYVEHFDGIEEYRLYPGDVLLSHINSLPMVGNCALFEYEEPLYGGMNLLHIRPNTQVIGEWLWNWLRGSVANAIMKSIAKHAINQVSISTGNLKAIPVLVPPYLEQRAIVAFLDRETAKIDALVAKHERLIEVLQEKRAALISHTATKGLDPTVPMKDSGIPWLGEIPAHWDVAPVWTLFALGRGRVMSNIEIQDNPGPYPVYSSQTENEGVMGYINAFQFEGIYLTWTTDGAKAGTVFYREGRFNCTNVCGTLRATSPQVETKFFEYGLNVATSFFVRHDINPKLMNNVMGRIRVQKPPLEEQRAIVTELDRETAELDALIAKTREMIERLQEYRTALISAAVTGKIDVRDDQVQRTSEVRCTSCTSGGDDAGQEA